MCHDTDGGPLHLPKGHWVIHVKTVCHTDLISSLHTQNGRVSELSSFLFQRRVLQGLVQGTGNVLQDIP